jgi:hypothetical protein
MTSSIDIVNLSLSKLGSATRIISLNDGTQEAITAKLFYDPIRKELLSQNDWSFARKRASLAALVDTPVYGFERQFELPSDYLSLISVGEFFPPHDYSTVRNFNNSEYAIENGMILTDKEAPLKILYTADIVDTEKFSASFVIYMATYLAYHMCEEITQSNTKKQLLEKEAADMRQKAVSFDRMQKPPQYLGGGSWEDSRVNNYGSF